MTVAARTPDLKAIDLLDRVKGVFSDKGFDGASMQDLARAAGISAGNFYRYFPSKNAIVEAMVERDLAGIEADFIAIMSAPDTALALRDTIRRRITTFDGCEGPLWAEIEAAATRRTEIAEVSIRMQSAVVTHLIRVFARIAGVSEDQARTRFGAHALLVMMLVKGTAIQCSGPDQDGGIAPREALNDLVLRQIDRLIDEIAGTVPCA